MARSVLTPEATTPNPLINLAYLGTPCIPCRSHAVTGAGPRFPGHADHAPQA